MTRQHQAANILIVDDDESVLASLSLLLKQSGLRSCTASGPEQAMQRLANNPIDLVLQDMNFSRQTSGDEGMSLLHQIKPLYPTLPIILMTAWGSIELAVQGIKQGAADFITKPWNNQHLLQQIQTCLSLSSNTTQQEHINRQALDQAGQYSAIIGEHPKLLSVLHTVSRVAKTDASVLILGESGTGKELIANAIHRNSKRADQNWIKVNLGGVPSSLFESEMFGHVKGAFTDAKTNRKGYFEQADQGSIFLDEAGDLDKASQVKLLSVLQDHTYQPVGASKTQHANVRVIAATNRDLEKMVAQNLFREDLLYRLNLITLKLPPLRERRSDIKLLSHFHLKQIAENYSLPELSLSQNAIDWLSAQEWPGNIRELKHCIERTVLMTGKLVLDVDDFHPNTSSNNPTDPTDSLSQLKLDEVEKLMIERSLLQHQNNISQTAQALGLSRAALYRRMEKHQIVPSGTEPE